MPNIVDRHTIEVLTFINAELRTSGTEDGVMAGPSDITANSRQTGIVFNFIYKNGYPSATGNFAVAWYRNSGRTQPTSYPPTSESFNPTAPQDADGNAEPSGIADYADADTWRAARLTVTAPDVTRLATDPVIFEIIYGRITIHQANFDRSTGDDGVP